MDVHVRLASNGMNLPFFRLQTAKSSHNLNKTPQSRFSSSINDIISMYSMLLVLFAIEIHIYSLVREYAHFVVNAEMLKHR